MKGRCFSSIASRILSTGAVASLMGLDIWIRPPTTFLITTLDITTFFVRVKLHRVLPMSLRSPKNEPFVPPNGKKAIGAATPC